MFTRRPAGLLLALLPDSPFLRVPCHFLALLDAFFQESCMSVPINMARLSKDSAPLMSKKYDVLRKEMLVQRVHSRKKGTAPEEKEPNLSRHMLHSFRSSLNASREGAQGQQGKTPFSCPALAVSRTCWSTHPHTKITISHTISKCIHIHIYIYTYTYT